MTRAGSTRAGVVTALEVLGPLGRPDAPLGALTTYRVGGAAAVMATPASVADLVVVRRAIAASGLDVLVVGRGSNMLVADAGFAGLAVLLDTDAFSNLTVSWEGDEAVVAAGAALPLPALARRSVEAGATGLEWAVGVPGSVGGGVRMNAGGHGSDVATSFVSCRVFDLASPEGTPMLDVDREGLGAGYRHTALPSSGVVVDAVLRARRGDRDVGLSSIRDIVRWRREHQPGGQNAGSVFINPTSPHPVRTPTRDQPHGTPPAAPTEGPVPTSAGWLVEAAGLKGHRLGSAAVSSKHANFIQADPGGSADDVHALIDEVRQRIHDRFGVLLRTEIRLVGFPAMSRSQLDGEG